MLDLWPLQVAIVAALKAAPATYPVYNAVPQGVPRRYIVIGEWSATPDDELAAATADASVMLHAWWGTLPGAAEQNVGNMDVHAMLEFIRARLDNEPLSGAWACSEDFAEIMEDPSSTADKRLFHGVARYRLRIG